jgi:hypothetical protein
MTQNSLVEKAKSGSDGMKITDTCTFSENRM